MVNIVHQEMVYDEFNWYDKVVDNGEAVKLRAYCDYVRHDHPEERYFPSCMSVKYQAHIQTTGDQMWKKDGEMAGTENQSKRIEGIRIKLDTKLYHYLQSSDETGVDEYWNLCAGGVEYISHIQGTGWETTWKSNGGFSGTTGLSKRVEAIQILLVPKNGIDPTNKPLINYEGKQSVMSAPCVFATDNL